MKRVARDIGRAVAPRFYRRLDRATAGTITFLIRLTTIAVTLLVALQIAQVSPATLVAGGAFTAVVVDLAAQQTLGNLFAGLVLVSVRPFRVGERVRLQGEDRIMIPNTAVLSAAVLPVRELDDEGLIVRVLATPAKAADGGKLADEAVAALTALTRD